MTTINEIYIYNKPVRTMTQDPGLYAGTSLDINSLVLKQPATCKPHPDHWHQIDDVYALIKFW